MGMALGGTGHEAPRPREGGGESRPGALRVGVEDAGPLGPAPCGCLGGNGGGVSACLGGTCGGRGLLRHRGRAAWGQLCPSP